MKELKKIKKKYGESMMKFCRDSFPLLLDQEGLLFSLLEKSIHKDIRKEFFKDLESNNKVSQFKSYIYSIAGAENNNAPETTKTVRELLDEVGYNFYECKTVEDVEQFKNHFKDGESLCTFNNVKGRLNTCHIFWIVRKEIDEHGIDYFDDKREMKRQDEYGTSSCSIQFAKKGNYLSIKNRYNHKVNNPDATFSNNLENIAEGLTAAFEEEYDIKVNTNKNVFDMPKYCNINGKFYKYNQEIDGRYFGTTFYQDSDMNVVEINPDTQRVIGYHLLDFKKKSIEALIGQNKDLDMTFEKIIVYDDVEEYRKEEDEAGILKICFVDS